MLPPEGGIYQQARSFLKLCVKVRGFDIQCPIALVLAFVSLIVKSTDLSFLRDTLPDVAVFCYVLVGSGHESGQRSHDGGTHRPVACTWARRMHAGTRPGRPQTGD